MTVCDGRQEVVGGTDFISSIPVSEFVRMLDPPAPADVLVAAGKIVDRPQIFDDNGIYTHDPDVHVGRIQNFKNWSPDMGPDPGKTSLGLEYFCTEVFRRSGGTVSIGTTTRTTRMITGMRESEVEQVHALTEVFAKLGRVAMGLSLGLVSGVLLCLATVGLLLKGGATVGPTLALLGQYFPGYSVTPAGSAVGLAYGFLTGFVLGWTFGLVRNATIFFYAAVVYRKAEFRATRNILEYL